MPQHAIGPPLLGQLHNRTRQIAIELFELGFKAREERKGVRGGSRESPDDLVVVKAPQLLRRSFQHFRSQRHLTVTGHHHFTAPADAQDGCGTYSFFHVGWILNFSRDSVAMRWSLTLMVQRFILWN